MKTSYLIAILLTVLTLLVVPGTAFAYCPCEVSFAPPQLDEQQATTWINTSPWARPYLARMWDIDPRVAEFYGASYKSPSCGNALTVSQQQIYIFDSAGNPITTWTTVDYMTTGPWRSNIKYVEDFVPTPINYPELPKSEPLIVKFDDAPPTLDMVQAMRWHLALPSARMYLAGLYGISSEEAQKYGAR